MKRSVASPIELRGQTTELASTWASVIYNPCRQTSRICRQGLSRGLTPWRDQQMRYATTTLAFEQTRQWLVMSVPIPGSTSHAQGSHFPFPAHRPTFSTSPSCWTVLRQQGTKGDFVALNGRPVRIIPRWEPSSSSPSSVYISGSPYIQRV